jgi:hypothetical protein
MAGAPQATTRFSDNYELKEELGKYVQKINFLIFIFQATNLLMLLLNFFFNLTTKL